MVKLVSDNEITKIFEYEEKEIKLVLSKAYDEETTKHYLVASIPQIKELNVSHIQFPFEFLTEEERNDVYKNFQAEDFLNAILIQIKQQTDEAKKNDVKTEEADFTEAEQPKIEE